MLCSGQLMNCSKLTRFPTISIFHTASKFQCWAVSLSKNFCDWNAPHTIGMSKTKNYPKRHCTIASIITVSEWQSKNHKNNVKTAFHNQNNLEAFLQNLWTLFKHVTNVIDVHNFNIQLDKHIQLKYIHMTKAFTKKKLTSCIKGHQLTIHKQQSQMVRKGQSIKSRPLQTVMSCKKR